MKWAFFMVLVGVFAGLSAKSQKLTEAEVPVIVRNAFEKKYPHLRASWNKEDADYEANFKQNSKAMSAVIDRNGRIVETETSITVTDLPRTIQDYVKKNYPGEKIEEAARIVKANGDINYEAEVHHKDIVFDAEGKFIKEVKD